MTKLFIYPYASGSESAKLLAERLGALRIKLSNSSYEDSEDNLVINWGSTTCPYPSLNQASLLKATVNKLSFFRLLTQKGMSNLLPRYWTNSEDIPDDAFPVFCRGRLEGMDGDGISIANNRSELVDAKMYTSAVKGTEYRVTLFRGVVTDIQTKRPRVGQDAHQMIKTYANGWGFQRLEVGYATRSQLTEAAVKVLGATGLDFAGIDMIHTAEGVKVLEVNSAMGIEGDALERFAQAVEAYVKEVDAQKALATPQTAPVASQPVSQPPQDLLAAVGEGRWADVIVLAAKML